MDGSRNGSIKGLTFREIMEMKNKRKHTISLKNDPEFAEIQAKNPNEFILFNYNEKKIQKQYMEENDKISALLIKNSQRK